MENLSPPVPLSTGYTATIWRRLFGLNLSSIEPGLFVGGAFTARQWPHIHALGVRAVLNLRAERLDPFREPFPERTLRLHVTDFFAPSLEQLATGVAFIADCCANDLPVLVHCRAGVGRAPTTAAAYLIAHRQMSVPAALAYLASARPIIGLNHGQTSRLYEWEKQVRATMPPR